MKQMLPFFEADLEVTKGMLGCDDARTQTNGVSTPKGFRANAGRCPNAQVVNGLLMAAARMLGDKDRDATHQQICSTEACTVSPSMTAAETFRSSTPWSLVLLTV